MRIKSYRVAFALVAILILAGGIVFALSRTRLPKGVQTDHAVKSQKFPKQEFDEKIDKNAKDMLAEGREIFRYDSFGSEAFWGEKLQLHKAILREKKGGIGQGLSARRALQLGLKADSDKIPALLVEVLKEGSVDLDDPDTTLELLRANAVVGVKGVFDKEDNLISVGITCALCHSSVDDSFMKGHRAPTGWLAEPRPRHWPDHSARPQPPALYVSAGSR